MSDRGYFGKGKTGGANASRGFAYQDFCIILYLLKNIDVRGFKAIGVETDDDFTLIHENKKTLFQVKYEELSISLAKEYLGDNKVLIGPSKNKSLSNLINYLHQYRNHRSSCEDVSEKKSVSKDFKEILRRNGMRLEDLDDIPDTWSVEVVSEDKVEEYIKLKIIEWGVKNGFLLDWESCLNDLRVIVADSRAQRRYLERSDVTSIFKKYSKKLVISEGYSSSLDALKSLELDENKIINSVDSKISQAESLLTDKRYEEALAIYKKLSDFVTSEHVFVRCAAILQMMGNFDEAISYCDRAIDVNKKFHNAYAVKGTLLGDKGDFDFALELLKTAEYLSGDDPFVLYNVGVTYMKLEDLDKAIEYFHKTISAGSELSSPHLNLGVCLYSKGVFSESLKHIDIALILEPGLPKALSQKGEIKRFYGELDEAVKLFERCLLNDSCNPIAELGLALCLIEKGNPLGYGLLVRKYRDELSRLEVGKSIGIVDIGWDRTICISIKNINGDSFLVTFDGVEVYVPKPGDDMIGVGVVELQEGLVPLILKSYADLNAYANAVNAIRLSEDSSLFIHVNGFIKDKIDHCEVQIKFDSYSIYGKTNACDNRGFKAFSDNYDGSLMLLLNHKETNQEVEFYLVGLECC